MISPSGLMLKGPGIIIPVFFLSLVHATLTAQLQWPEASAAAIGGAFVCLDGYENAGQNQAVLGFAERSSISLQHGRPFLLKDLGISSLSGQFTTGRGALGVLLSNTGLRGLRQSSLWLAFGQRLHPCIGAGVGLHFWNTSVREKLLYAPGISFALGIQIRIQDQWRIGTRVFHPATWTRLPEASGDEVMRIESGFSYSFFDAARIYAELHIKPGIPITLCGGAEWFLNRRIVLRTGICSLPFTYSWGISFRLKQLVAEFSCMYMSSTGFSPLSALTYEW